MLVARKVAADLWNARGRAGLVVLAMATGLFAVVCIATTNTVLTREMRRSFAAIAPASAIIRTEPLPASILDSVRRVPGVGAADGGRVLSLGAQIGDERKPVALFSVADYGHITVNRLRPQTGAWPPPRGKVLLERAAVRVAGIRLGDTLMVGSGRQPPVALEFAGTLHDFSQAPAWQEGMIYGYVSGETMARLVGGDGLTEIRIIVAERASDVAHIRDVARAVAQSIERTGTRVRDIQVPPPGEHPHQGQMNALLGIQQAFGVVALLLGGALIVVLLNAMLVQHRRQIGAMKAIGARRGAIVRMYLLWIVALAACAELIALPAGIFAGRVYARFIAEMLNFDVANQRVPAALLFALIAIGAALPLVVALLPIVRASAITTREALAESAPIPAGALGARRWPLLNTRVGRLSALGVANALRAPGRFGLVVGTMAVGGALFLSALNLGQSFQATVAVNIARAGYDIIFGVGDETPPPVIEAALLAVPGVLRVDMAVRTNATIADPRDASPNTFAIQGAETTTLPPVLTQVQGRWLRAGDQRVVVANHAWVRAHPLYAVGDSIALGLGSETSRWLLAGVVREVMSGPTLYAPTMIVDQASRGRARATIVRVVCADHDPAAVNAVSAAIAQQLADRGARVTGGHMQSLQSVQQSRSDHVLVIVDFLLAIAALSLLVGGLGLATMLSVGVFERSQEIGVMRAVGATRWQLLVLIVVEGGWVAFAGWLGSIALSLPATWLLDRVFGRMMLATPLDVHLSAGAIPALAAVAGFVAIAASGLPAWRATTLEPRTLLVSV